MDGTRRENVPTPDGTTDPFAWLEEIDSDRALDWVRARNAATMATLAAGPAFARTQAAIREVLDAPDRLTEVSLHGGLLYNYWRDAEHPRGLWRRTAPESFAAGSPQWQTVLDVDALNRTEKEDWVWHGASVLRPDARRALVALSHGGSDADVTRELDLETSRLVEPAEGGFLRPEGKGSLTWIDQDTVFLVSDLGPGTTTVSGYPRTVRRWRRGTPIDQAVVVHEIAETDLAVGAYHDHTPGFARDVVERAIGFYTQETSLLAADGSTVRIEVPTTASAELHRDWLLVHLREDWPLDGAVHPAGSLLAAPLAGWLAGNHQVTALFTPTPSTSLSATTWTRHHLVLTVLADVVQQRVVLTPPEPAAPGPWPAGDLPGLPELATVGVRGVDRMTSDDVWLLTTGYTTPPTLSVARVGQPPTVLQQVPAAFDTTGTTVTRHMVTSADGTRVPYTQVTPPGGDQPRPTLLYGYGGFEVSLLPAYSPGMGRAWLADGGVYVVANIRGGGEYGPTWHQAALKSNRHRAYEDFAAVARDLVARGVTTESRLAVQGGSNGGLLTANMLTGYPDLVGAVVVQVPLVDMKRYPHLLAGASWKDEYGDPDDPEQWEFIRTFSPYHLLDADRAYPPVLVTTSTRDDRVHPAHARKLAAWLLAAGKDVTYYENLEGGHGGAADNAQAAFMSALAYRFCWERLG